jgi:hypothetical protein
MLTVSFSPKASDGTNYDVKLDSTNNDLSTGTVAGAITLTAQIGGTNIVAQDGTGSVILQVPRLRGTILAMSLTNRTTSSFEVNVTGFSTPRGTGDTASAVTQVCFSFSPARGATVNLNAKICALKDDIEIWYERNLSNAYGSEFQGSVIFSFSGDMSAIGSIKSWVTNEVGESTPYCLDVKSGNPQACPN